MVLVIDIIVVNKVDDEIVMEIMVVINIKKLV